MKEIQIDKFVQCGKTYLTLSSVLYHIEQSLPWYKRFIFSLKIRLKYMR